MFSWLKNQTIQVAAQRYLDQVIQRETGKPRSAFGTIQKVELDTARAEIHVRVLLAGEDRPVQGTVGYALLEQNGKGIIRLGTGRFDRAWVQALYESLGQGREFPIPNGVRWMLD